MLERLIELLGGDNVKKIEDGITEIILDRIRADLEYYDTYILEPDDITEFAERCKEKEKIIIVTEQRIIIHFI